MNVTPSKGVMSTVNGKFMLTLGFVWVYDSRRPLHCYNEGRAIRSFDETATAQKL